MITGGPHCPPVMGNAIVIRRELLQREPNGKWRHITKSHYYPHNSSNQFCQIIPSLGLIRCSEYYSIGSYLCKEALKNLTQIIRYLREKGLDIYYVPILTCYKNNLHDAAKVD